MGYQDRSQYGQLPPMQGNMMSPIVAAAMERKKKQQQQGQEVVASALQMLKRAGAFGKSPSAQATASTPGTALNMAAQQSELGPPPSYASGEPVKLELQDNAETRFPYNQGRFDPLSGQPAYGYNRGGVVPQHFARGGVASWTNPYPNENQYVSSINLADVTGVSGNIMRQRLAQQQMQQEAIQNATRLMQEQQQQEIANALRERQIRIQEEEARAKQERYGVLNDATRARMNSGYGSPGSPTGEAQDIPRTYTDDQDREWRQGAGGHWYPMKKQSSDGLNSYQEFQAEQRLNRLRDEASKERSENMAALKPNVPFSRSTELNELEKRLNPQQPKAEVMTGADKNLAPGYGVKVGTAEEIRTEFKAGKITREEAKARLQALGYE